MHLSETLILKSKIKVHIQIHRVFYDLKIK